MIDETTSQSAAPESSSGDASAEPVVAFCQQCGRALTASTRRQIGTSIFCEPCATAHEAAGWAPVNAAAAPYPAEGPVPGEPNPGLAGFLGLIPGVGAMYNGQYAKGVIHLIVFVVLVSLADNLNWVFWWLVWGWIFYQAFEAYHTARARRDGLPLPDPFGWNELGDRLGLTRTTPPRPVRRSRVTGFQPVPATPTPGTPSAPPAQAVASAPPLTSSFGQETYAAPPKPEPAAGSAAYTQVPYTTAYTRNAGVPVPPPGTPYGQPQVVVGRQTFPIGAVWLIGLGILFLLGNILPTWHITARWLVPILLAILAFWTGSRRLVEVQQARAANAPASIAGAILGPAMLLTVAVLLGMQAAYWVPLRHSWPALLIVWGALLLLERGQNPTPPAGRPPDPLTNPVPPPPDRSPR